MWTNPRSSTVERSGGIVHCRLNSGFRTVLCSST
uniref:Uncharacterized protein n=1 Tax=Anguilla anguilla TaxID=7936 RepID=A0A0E9TQ37_ANGAN